MHYKNIILDEIVREHFFIDRFYADIWNLTFHTHFKYPTQKRPLTENPPPN